MRAVSSTLARDVQRSPDAPGDGHYQAEPPYQRLAALCGQPRRDGSANALGPSGRAVSAKAAPCPDARPVMCSHLSLPSTISDLDCPGPVETKEGRRSLDGLYLVRLQLESCQKLVPIWQPKLALFL
jgi:hypothetical protein